MFVLRIISLGVFISYRRVDGIAVALLDKLQMLIEGRVHLWVTFITGMNLRYLAAHDIARSFVNGAALTLHAFHAFNRCDTVSCFHGKGKKKARTSGNVS